MTWLCRLGLHYWLYESPVCDCRHCTRCGVRQQDPIESRALSALNLKRRVHD